MKKVLLISTLGAFLLSACGESDNTSGTVKLDTEEQKVSYVMGVSVAKGVDIKNFAFDEAAFKAGLDDVKQGEPRLTQEEMSKVFHDFQIAQRDKALAKNKADGEAFLSANASKAGVKTTESGLQYEVLAEGTGPLPTRENIVKTNYVGSLVDGTVFDASERHGGPAQFPVGGVIAGWTEALLMMPVGSKWKLYIPSDLAYGTRGSPPVIGPNSALIFEIELLEILESAPMPEGHGDFVPTE